MSLLDELRIDVGDDDPVVPSGVSSHEILSASHGDTIPGLPGNASLIVGNGTRWLAYISGAETSILRIQAGSIQWVPTTLPSGNVVGGPSSSTDNAIARWDGITGQYVQNSFVIIDDNGNITIPSGKIVGGNRDSNTYIILTTEDYLKVITATGVTVVLPQSPQNWEEHVIKDGAGIAGSSPINIYPSGQTIDGATSAQIGSNYGSLTAVFNGIEWSII